MAKLSYFMVLLIVGCCFLCPTIGIPTPDEMRRDYLNKDYNCELINWLTSVQYPPQQFNPYKYYCGNSLTGSMPKRNSELINSLLSLPKNMNEAGK